MEMRVASLEDSASTIQIDITDGVCVPSTSWPYNVASHTDIALPNNKDIFYEIDLMVAHPFDAVSDWMDVGARRFIFHDYSEELFSTITTLHENDCEVGIAIQADTSFDIFRKFLLHIDIIQCMGIARIGFQGQDFDARILTTIASLKEEWDGVISVDGSVNKETCVSLIESGATRLVVGSAIFSTDNPKEAFLEIQAKCGE